MHIIECQQLILVNDPEEAILSESDCGHDEDITTVGCDINLNGS